MSILQTYHATMLCLVIVGKQKKIKIKIQNTKDFQKKN
jgi:hypothetical protein